MAVSANVRGYPMADINITPLVDVMLVLLIIFMVAAPMLDSAQVFDTSRSQKAPPLEPARLQVEAGDVFVLDGQALSLPQLREELALMARTQPERALHVAVHPDSEYQSLASALSTARSAGVGHIALPGATR